MPLHEFRKRRLRHGVVQVPDNARQVMEELLLADHVRDRLHPDRLGRLLPSPLGIEVSLALAGGRCLLLATLLGVDRSLALGGCSRFLLSPRGVGRC